jgi:hypothetical protein
MLAMYSLYLIGAEMLFEEGSASTYVSHLDTHHEKQSYLSQSELRSLPRLD